MLYLDAATTLHLKKNLYNNTNKQKKEMIPRISQIN